MKFIDLHCDTLMRGASEALKGNHYPLAKNDGHIDIDKMRRGVAMAQFFACFIPTYDAKREYLLDLSEQDVFDAEYAYFKRELELNKDDLAQACNADEIIANDKAGKISGILAIEDGVIVDGKMENLDKFFSLGVRLITLTWNFENCFGFPNKQPDFMPLGLKPFGIEAIKYMNDIGMIIDVSHLSDGGFWDVVKHTKKPFVASHSCARALCNHTRCLTDEMLKALGDTGGVCGINFCSPFIEEGSSYTSIENVVRHMRRIADKAGLAALAFGSDFDGIAGSTLEFVDYAGLPLIVRELEKYFTPDELDLITTGNALRVIRETMK